MDTHHLRHFVKYASHLFAKARPKDLPENLLKIQNSETTGSHDQTTPVHRPKQYAVDLLTPPKAVINSDERRIEYVLIQIVVIVFDRLMKMFVDTAV